MFYFEDNCWNRYFCRYDGKLFKTKGEYYEYLKSAHTEPIRTSVFRHRRNAVCRAEYPEGKWIEYDLAPGTELFDERDLSVYKFDTEAAARELMKAYTFNRDVYATCPFEGYEEEAIPEAATETAEPFDPSKANKTVAHFILSYLPDDAAKRAKRYAAHRKQIENIKRITPQAKIHIVAQNYAESEYMVDPQIEYRKFERGIGAGRARNECLRWLYGSDYEYGIISDDDALLRETETAAQFYREVETAPEKFIGAGIDVCYPRNMYHYPWNSGDVRDANRRGVVWDFGWMPSGWFHWTLFRNLKKAYDRELYQREDIDPSKGQGYDDMDFSYTLMDSGVRCFCEWTLQQVSQLIEEEASVAQSLADGNYRAKSLNATRAKFLRRTPQGGWDYDDLRARNGHPFCITIPKEAETDVWNEISGGRAAEMKADFIRERLDVKPI